MMALAPASVQSSPPGQLLWLFMRCRRGIHTKYERRQPPRYAAYRLLIRENSLIMKYSEKQAWLDDANFPISSRDEFSVLGKKAPYDQKSIWKLCCQWQPVSGLLVAQRKNDRFLPLICLEQYQASCEAAYMGRTGTVAKIIAAYIAFCMLLAVYHGVNLQIAIAISIGGIVAWQIYREKRLYVRDPSWLRDKARFFAWLLNNKMYWNSMVAIILIIAAMGMSQCFLQLKYGSLDSLFEKYGTYYEKIEEGELWRLISGAFLHNSLAHFASNAILLAFIAPGLFVFERWLVATVFVAGCGAGSLAQWQLMPLGDGLLGISAGVMALYAFGFTRVASLRAYFPAGLSVQIFLVAVLAILAGVMFGASVASLAHVAGFATGGWMALIFRATAKGH